MDVPHITHIKDGSIAGVAPTLCPVPQTHQNATVKPSTAIAGMLFLISSSWRLFLGMLLPRCTYAPTRLRAHPLKVCFSRLRDALINGQMHRQFSGPRFIFQIRHHIIGPFVLCCRQMNNPWGFLSIGTIYIRRFEGMDFVCIIGGRKRRFFQIGSLDCVFCF